MSCYQKFYTNQIHSSSLLCQLATMWKSQVLCDAVIRTGPVITKAHRVVLVAACPMLQSMDNASMGSHLEVRLAADIKQDSINTFLQYLYEGFMMLTEENCRDVEKIARLLQVDSVIKCCADFLKCLNGATGAPMPMDSQYKYTSYDMLEFRHVRSSGLQKSVNMKRMSNFPRPVSPGSKRQRMGRPSSPLVDSHSSSHRADDTLSMAHSYRSSQPDPWDRVPQLGAGTRLPTQPGVIDIVEDCLEIIQTEEPEKDARGNVKPDSRPKQKSVSIGVSSQMNTATDVHVVNISDPGGTAGPPKQTTTNGSRGSITVNPLTMFNDPTSSSQGLQRSDTSNDVQFSPRSVESEAARKENFPHAMTPPQQPVFPTMTPISRATNKPFAAGSATQVHPSESGGKTQAESEEGDQAQDQVNRVESQELSPSSSSDKAPDISIVKVEAADAHTGGLDMYVDIPEDGIMRMKSGIEESIENEEESDPEHDQSQDALRDDMSNEASNVSGDQNNSWYIGQFKALPFCARSDNVKTLTALDSLGVPNSAEHYLVKTEKNSKKLCEFCKQNRNKSKGGWWVYTRYMCKDCKVPLCNGKSCLFFFHRDILLKILQSFPSVSQGEFLELWNEAILKAQNSGKSRSAVSCLDTNPSFLRISSSQISTDFTVEQLTRSNRESPHGLQVPLNRQSYQNMAHVFIEDCESDSDTYSEFKLSKDM
ncbi:uncharacterized protein LOC133189918 isoform X5 [Saccostrea echinata]|uniref:uncharacterized protein LOC133189918 isoform X5 n=1 Tax=Saccostrea echinata TaxID=191078 RepID=UPI002A7F9665|nr:uncharacterized protein LOC133189918 isoform X5 [Saccostrea echinata]